MMGLVDATWKNNRTRHWLAQRKAHMGEKYGRIRRSNPAPFGLPRRILYNEVFFKTT
jgi:hypothetical protein